jgi:hypothetical protein
MSMSMTLDEVDRALARLGAVSDRVASQLVAMDGHQGPQLLDAAALTGPSQRRWAEAKARHADLWTCFEAHRSALAIARELRTGRPSPDDLARLTTLLRTRSIALAPDEASPPGADPSEWVSFDELGARMDADYGAVLAVVDAASSGWSALAKRLDPLTGQLAAARAVAAELGLADDLDLAAVDADLTSLRLSDPLPERGSTSEDAPSVDGTGDHADVDGRIRAVGVRLDRAMERLDRARRLRDGYQELRAGLAARIDRFGAADAAAHELFETVRAKIAFVDPDPDPAPAPGGAAAATAATAGTLRAALDELDGWYGARDWNQLAQRYAEVDAQVAEADTAAQARATSLRELLDRRAELRGRLDAYRAKAGRLGHSEDITLTDLHHEAHELLWAAPCDLAAATKAVAHYQQAVLAATAQQGVATAQSGAATARRGEVPR